MRNVVAIAVLLLIYAAAPIGAAMADSAKAAAPTAQLPSISDVDHRALMILLGLCVIGFQLRRKYRSSEHSWQRIATADRPTTGAGIGRSEIDPLGTEDGGVEQVGANQACNDHADDHADEDAVPVGRLPAAGAHARQVSV